MTLVQKEIKAVYMWTSEEVNDMQGPCPDGFHVPTGTEWTNIIVVCNSLGTNMWILKLPIPGYRDNANPILGNLGTAGGYWTCIGGTSYVYRASCLWINEGSVQGLEENNKTMGFSIRPFKNEAVTPDNNWTVLKQGTGTAGIYHNSSLGLISLSSDGTTWYTIQDKNLGATTVWNSGDTLTDANCGYFYQRGNNYGFPHSGTVTASSTTIDASNYGPGNYYSSNTFITNYSNWDSSANQNLWGGVSQGTGTVLVEHKVRPTTPPIAPVNKTFSYTGSDQTWTVPYTQEYIITCKGAGSRSAAGGFAQGTFTLTAGDTLSIMVGQTGNSGNSATYGFGGNANGGSNAAGGGLSGVFTGNSTITASDSARALVIGGGAGGSSAGTGGQGGGTTGGTGIGSYGTAGAGGTQTGRGSSGNAGANQFNGGSGSRTYGYGGGGGWRGGNGSIGDGSGDDDKGGGGGSGYVKSTATNAILTTGGGAAAKNNGTVTIVSVGNESSTPVTPGGCFLKGTAILMKEGCKNIEDIVEGDVALSFNEEKEEIEYNNVVNFIKHPYNGKIIKLNGGLIEATSNHPVYTSKDKEDRDYKFIGDIVEGDWLYTKDGYVQVVEKEERDYSGDVYNFTVDNNHNYFVGDGILVHNATTGAGIQ